MASRASTAALQLSVVTIPGWNELVSGRINGCACGGAAAATSWSIFRGTATPPSSSGLFGVVSGPCTTSQGGRCVGRRYSERNPWPLDGRGVFERCEIVVLKAGALARAPLLDTVSFGPGSGGHGFAARHDAVGSAMRAAHQWIVPRTMAFGRTSSRARPRAHQTRHVPPAGTSGPPVGTTLTAGEHLTWVAAAADDNAHETGSGYAGAASNLASAHDGWEFCFV